MPQSNYYSGLAQRRSRGLAALTALGLSAIFASNAFGQSTVQLQTVAQPVLPIVSRSINLGPADPSQVLHVTITLQPSDRAAMEAFATSVSDPNSPNYMHFITPKEFGVRFGQPTAKFQSAVDYLSAQGFKVRLVGDNNLSVVADCTVAQAERAFNTRINRYHAVNANERGRLDFFANAITPSMPANVAGVTLDISGLDNQALPIKKSTLTPAQVRTLYNALPIFGGGFTGLGRTIGISNWDGFRLSNVPLFYSSFGLPSPAGGVGSNITVKTFSGGSGSGTPQGEGDLDIQMALGQAPLANLVVYDGAAGFLEVITGEANDNLCDVISESWGWFGGGTSGYEAGHVIHTQMTTQGITYLVASGDYGTQDPDGYPDYETEVLNVGGTTATVDGAGKRITEISWSGSGGGYSTIGTTFNKRPSWQKGKGVPASPNFRLVPDVAGHASDNFAAYYFFVNGGKSTGDGTSFTSPVWAGQIAITEQKLISNGGITTFGSGKKRLGRLNDKIYTQNGRSDVWFDIVSGPGNGTLPDGSSTSVTPGWDYVTGWGAIDWNKFASTFSLSAPVILSPNAVAIYANQGANLVGTPAALAAANDNAYVTLGTINQTGTGAVASLQVSFSTSTDLSKLTAAVVSGSATLPTKATGYVYALNYATNTYDQLGTVVGNGAYSTFSYSLNNPTNYFNSSKQLTVLVRGLLPTRLGGVPFTLGADQVIVTLGF